MFIFKNKEISIDCFTCIDAINRHTPIDYTHKFIPDWWKDIVPFKSSPFKFKKTPVIQGHQGHELVQDKNMKTCNGFIDFFRSGFTIPLWSSFVAKSENGVFKFDFALKIPAIIEGGISHPRMQYPGFMDDNYYHLKMLSPWIITTKSDVNWTWVPHVWNFKTPEDMIILPGTLNFKNQCTSNINAMFNLKNFKEILLEPGQAMVNVIPQSDKKIKIHTHTVSVPEWNNIYAKHNGRLNMFFSKRLNKALALERESEARKNKGCPF
jgi:hypothetical protein